MGRAGRKEEWSTSCHPYTHCICPVCLSVCMCRDVSISLHAMFSDIVFLCAYVPVCVCVCVSVPSSVFGWFCSLVVHLYHSAYRSVALYLALSLLPRLSLVV